MTAERNDQNMRLLYGEPEADLLDLAAYDDHELDDGEAASEDSGPESFLDRFLPPFFKKS